METIARAKHIRIGPRKLRLLRDLILQKEAREAIQVLQNTSKRGSKILIKVLKSALANTSQHPSESGWQVKSFVVDGGPVLKRFRAAAMGRGTVIRKRTSHVTVILEELKTKGNR